MIGIIDKNTKEAHIRWVLNNKTKQILLPIFNIYVEANNIESLYLEEKYSVKTRVYSESFSSY